MKEFANNVSMLVQYFSTDDKPVSMQEWFEFWGPLTSEERGYYRWVDLKTSLMPIVSA